MTKRILPSKCKQLWSMGGGGDMEVEDSYFAQTLLGMKDMRSQL
jgi:hypothetical protein